MMVNITVMMTMAIMTMLPFTSGVLTMGMSLMIVAIMSTVLLTSKAGSWFGFILFLMYITGLLVLFSYMLAMTPNSQQPSTTGMKPVTLILLTVTALTSMKAKSLMNPMKEATEEEISQLYNNNNMPMYWTMAIILLITLIMVVKLCYKSPKPLRQYLS